MTIIEKLDERGRKILRVKQSTAELHEELARLRAKHARWLAMSKSVRSLEGEKEKEQWNDSQS